MSSFERRQFSDEKLQGTVNQLSPIEQLPFPETNAFPVYTVRRDGQGSTRSPATPEPETPFFTNPTQPLSDQNTATHVTRILAFNASPLVTRQLPDLQNQSQMRVLNPDGTTTSLRQPVVIRGSGKKSPGTMRPPRVPRGRKWVVSSAIFGLLIALILVTGTAVIPLETGNSHAAASLPLIGALFQNHDANNNPVLVGQAATATAITRQDGYDPSTNNNNNQPPVYSGSGVTPDRFAFGQCT